MLADINHESNPVLFQLTSPILKVIRLHKGFQTESAFLLFSHNIIIF